MHLSLANKLLGFPSALLKLLGLGRFKIFTLFISGEPFFFGFLVFMKSPRVIGDLELGDTEAPLLFILQMLDFDCEKIFASI